MEGPVSYGFCPNGDVGLTYALERLGWARSFLGFGAFLGAFVNMVLAAIVVSRKRKAVGAVPRLGGGSMDGVVEMKSET